MIVNALGAWVVGVIDSLWWVLDQEEPEPGREEQLDLEQLGIPAGLAGMLEALVMEAGRQGYALTQVPDEGPAGPEKTILIA